MTKQQILLLEIANISALWARKVINAETAMHMIVEAEADYLNS